MSRGNHKPSLQGVRIKTRKGTAKAQAKTNTSGFRDQLFEELGKAPNNDFDKIETILISAALTLEYSKYHVALLEILFVGGIVQPSGSVDNVPMSPFSVFQAKSPPSIDDVRKYVQVLINLMRRHTYLRRTLESQTIPTLFRCISKWSDDELEKFGMAVGLLIHQFGSAACLADLRNDKFIQDATAPKVLAIVFRAYLQQAERVDQLTGALKRANLQDLSTFFPINHRTDDEVVLYFNSRKLDQVAEWYKARKQALAKEAIAFLIKDELVKDEWKDEPVKAEWMDEVISALHIALKEFSVSPTDVIRCLWRGFTTTVDWDDNTANNSGRVASEVKKFAPILAAICHDQPQVEIALINAVQTNCNEDKRITRVFPHILKVLYNEDCISDNAILTWHSKVSAPEGRQQFLKATEPLVKFLQDSEGESGSEED